MGRKYDANLSVERLLERVPDVPLRNLILDKLLIAFPDKSLEVLKRGSPQEIETWNSPAPWIRNRIFEPSDYPTAPAVRTPLWNNGLVGDKSKRWACCNQDEHTKGCWYGKHSVRTVFPDPQIGISLSTGTNHISNPIKLQNLGLSDKSFSSLVMFNLYNGYLPCFNTPNSILSNTEDDSVWSALLDIESNPNSTRVRLVKLHGEVFYGSSVFKFIFSYNAARHQARLNYIQISVPTIVLYGVHIDNLTGGLYRIKYNM
jgi:hypothetical protein